jgi:hypothetical protein
MNKVDDRARRFLALDSRVGELRLQQGEIVNEHVDDGGDLAALAARVDVSEDKLREYRRIYLFCEGHGLVDGASFEAHRLAADSGKDRAWLAGFARGSNGRATVDEVRQALGRKPATVNEVERAAHVLATRPPSETAGALAKVMRDKPALAEAVYEEQHRQTTEQVRARTGVTTQPGRVNPDEVQFDRYLNIEARLMDARSAMKTAATNLKDYTPSQQETARWRSILHDIFVLSNGVEEMLSGSADMDAALRELLTQEG